MINNPDYFSRNYKRNLNDARTINSSERINQRKKKLLTQ